MIDGDIGRLADESLRLSVRQAEIAVRLATAVQYAWLDRYLEGCRALVNALIAASEAQKRTRRLVGRGIPPEAAARALHIV